MYAARPGRRKGHRDRANGSGGGKGRACSNSRSGAVGTAGAAEGRKRSTRGRTSNAGRRDGGQIRRARCQRLAAGRASRSSCSIRFKASDLSADAARAIEISPTRSICGTRRSSAAISSYKSRTVCARVFASVVSTGVIVATAVRIEVFDESGSRPHHTENSANSYSRPGSWRSTRWMLTCRTDTIVASRQQHLRARLVDSR